MASSLIKSEIKLNQLRGSKQRSNSASRGSSSENKEKSLSKGVNGLAHFEFQPKLRSTNLLNSGLNSSQKMARKVSKPKKSRKLSMRDSLLKFFANTSMISSLDKNVFLKNNPFKGELQNKKNMRSKSPPKKVSRNGVWGVCKKYYFKDRVSFYFGGFFW